MAGYHLFKKSTRRDGKKLFFSDRLFFMQAGVVLAALGIVYRLFTMQVLEFQDYRAAAEEEHAYSKKLPSIRGDILLRERASSENNGFFRTIRGETFFPAVTNRDYALVYALPKNIDDPKSAAELLAPLLEVEKEKLFEKLSKKHDPYEMLKRKVSDSVVEEIKKLKLSGIAFSAETYRFYPDKGLGGHLFGFVGYSGDVLKGLYGLEGYFDQILKGKEGTFHFESDAAGSLIPLGKNKRVDEVNGSTLVLTIDRTLQLMACDRLKKWVVQNAADSGTVLIMDPKTGALRAMCSTPDFDPANYKESSVETYNNRAIFTPYEPGSIFKPITMAIGIELGKVTPETTYHDTGKVTIRSYTISNSDNKAHGTQTMTSVLEKSLNTGTVFVSRKIGIGDFRRFVKLFGFGEKTGIELDREAPGNIKALDEKGNEIYLATASFGQGIAVTPIQITSAFGALANGGTLMQPYIVDEIFKPDGTSVKTKPKVIRKIISERTASLVSGMLVNVVRKGHGKRAGVARYYVAGKTGTAQVSKKDGRGYEPDITVGSFIGYAPIDDPRFVMLVKIDHPRNVQWAESSAAPLFGELAQFILQYDEVPPDEK